MEFVYPPPESATDRRHTYYWELLDAALRSNRRQYGDYVLKPYRSAMSFARAEAELEQGDGRVNIVARATNRDLESRLRPIPLPLDKGLLGYRLLLIKADKQAALDKLRSLDELKQFSIGQSPSWTDAGILAGNGFKLELSPNYEGLFQMLGAGRFALFSRGINEIAAEWQTHKDAVPGLAIERHLMLHYPLPRYFFVPRTAAGERMAARIEDGLRRLVASGEFERRYRAYKKLVLADVSLSGRRVFELSNPQLSPLAPPLDDHTWWDSLASELGRPHRSKQVDSRAKPD
ncbi:hypothetical protein GCM10028811_21180 [Uliginosibacterium sediminicola]